MSLETSVFQSELDSSEASRKACPGVQVIDTIGVEVVETEVVEIIEAVETIEVREDILAVAPANLNGAPAPRLESAKPVPFASTLRHIA